jgi:hypothetical protein
MLILEGEANDEGEHLILVNMSVGFVNHPFAVHKHGDMILKLFYMTM